MLRKLIKNKKFFYASNKYSVFWCLLAYVWYKSIDYETIFVFVYLILFNNSYNFVKEKKNIFLNVTLYMKKSLTSLQLVSFIEKDINKIHCSVDKTFGFE